MFILYRTNETLLYCLKQSVVSYVSRYINDLVYNMVALENSPYSYLEVQKLLEGKTVGGHTLQDQQLILNTKNAWNCLVSNIEKFKVTQEVMCVLHSKAAFEEALEWGTFRNGPVYISGTEYILPDSDKLEHIFLEMLTNISELHPIEQAINIFLCIAYNQFFWDGNKRTGRLMASGILLSNNYPPLNVRAKDRRKFNNLMIDFYNTGNSQIIGDFLLNIIKEEIK